MNLEEMKELYATGEWICVFHNNGIAWQKMNKIPNVSEKPIKLIHKKHEHILDAYLDGCEVYVHCYSKTKGMHWEPTSMIDEYIVNAHYLAVPRTLENTWCVASELHRKVLNLQGVIGSEYYRIAQDIAIPCDIVDSSDKQVEYNTQINKWIYVPKEKEVNKTEKVAETLMRLSGNESQEDKPKNNFEEYGFTGDFEGEILKEVDGALVGYFSTAPRHNFPILWNRDTGEALMYRDINVMKDAYDLTPIKKEWYEDIPEHGVLCWVWDDYKSDKDIEIVNSYQPYEGLKYVGCNCSWAHATPLTQEEAQKYIYKDN